jgi:hypothetical protein
MRTAGTAPLILSEYQKSDKNYKIQNLIQFQNMTANSVNTAFFVENNLKNQEHVKTRLSAPWVDA